MYSYIFWLIFISEIRASFSGYQPLIFDPIKGKVYNSPILPDPVFDPPFAVACPAETEPELKLNNSHAIDHKALFVRKFYKEGTVISNPTMCEKDFQLSTGYFGQIGSEFISFGYEIFYEKPLLPKTAIKTSYGLAEPISFGSHSWWKVIPKTTKLFLKYPNFGFTKPLGYMWLSKIEIRYDKSTWRINKVKKVIYRNTDQLLDVECDDYKLGSAFFIEKEHGTLDDLYSEENQKKIFDLVDLSKLSEDSICKRTHKCLKKHNILMPYRFKPFAASPNVSCSNLTTVPIWYEINETLLNYLEIFLIAFSQVSGGEPVVWSGVHGTLSVINVKEQSEQMKIYLNPKINKIPIPKIVYKVVEYASHKCTESMSLCWCSIIIVIHNEPEFTEDDKLCPEDNCEQWGWGYIQYLNPLDKSKGKSKHIYCCEVEEQIMKKLGFEKGKYYNRRSILKLNYFPLFDINIPDNTYGDKQKEIEDKMEELMKKKTFEK